VENFSLQCEKIMQQEKDSRPKLLLHSCCAPCSSYVISYLAQAFNVTVFYYNPNISPREEYEKRKAEQLRLIQTLGVNFLDCEYEGEAFTLAAQGLENEPERGARCAKCFALRLQKTAQAAKDGGFLWFCTTLSVSPLKSAPLLNQIGQEMGKEYGTNFLPSDFKKKGGYLQSIELSRAHGLYRQDYCGCAFSKAQREREKEQKQTERFAESKEI
jgi:predicted adenine nucleotide alpha hydrolase (AANH) superfamily ATPase